MTPFTIETPDGKATVTNIFLEIARPDSTHYEEFDTIYEARMRRADINDDEALKTILLEIED